MIDKVKQKIDDNKKDIETINAYIKSFVESEKAKEIFKDNDDFKSLNKEKKEIKEDEYF